MKLFTRFAAAVLAAVTFLTIAACGAREYGFSRSAFNVKFVDKSIDQAIESAGQPDATEKPDANTTVLVYKKRTFDQENNNSKDAMAKITFKAGAGGKQMYTGIDFFPE